MLIFVIIGQSIRQTRSLGVYAYGFFGDMLESGKLEEAFLLTGRDCGCPFFNHNARSEQRSWA